ncbi:MAG: hydrogenase iron-sulfur subunit [Thermodesulfobacteriota bacterium]
MTQPPIRIIAFCCKNALESDPVLYAKGWQAFEPEIKIVSVPCSSKVETLGIIKAFEAGSDGVFVLACPDHQCRLLDGNVRAQRTIHYTKKLLTEINIDPERLAMLRIGTPDFMDLNQAAGYMRDRIRSMGKVL